MPQTELTGKNDLLNVVLPAAARGDLKTVKKLVRGDYNWVYATGPHGRSMLWEACYKNRMETVRFLLDIGANVNVYATYYTPLVVELTPYCVARRNGNEELAEMLAECGALCDLHSAAYLGDMNRLCALLDEHPELLNAPPRIETGEPIRLPNVKLNKTVREAAAEIEREAAAVFESDLESVQELVQSKKGPKYKKTLAKRGIGTRFHQKIGELGDLIQKVGSGKLRTRHRFAVVRELHCCWNRLKAQWQQEFRTTVDDHCLHTPLHYAVMGRQKKMAEFLVSQGADVKRFGHLLLDMCKHPDSENIFRLLLQSGADLGQAVNSSWVIDERMMTIAVENGVFPGIDDWDGNYPPLVDACRGNHNMPDDPARVQRFLDLGADVQARDYKGKTALHRAAQAGFLKIGKLLIKAGADLEARDSQGETPLFDAVRHGRLVTTKLLVNHGAKPKITNDRGKSLLEMAERSRKRDKSQIVRTLLLAKQTTMT